MERTYIVPLRKEFQKAPSYKHTKKAVQALREFMQRHMKNKEVRLGQHLNHALTARGRKNPPHKVKVRAWTEIIKKNNKDIEIVKVELFGAPAEKQAKIPEQPEKLAEKIEQVEKKSNTQEKIKEEVLKEEKKPLEKKPSQPAAPTPENKKPHDTKKTTRAAPHHAQHTIEKKK